MKGSKTTQQESQAFSTCLIKQLVLFHAKDDKPSGRNKRMSSESAHIAGELLRLFVVEARQRAAILAECEKEVEQDISGCNEAIEASSVVIRSDHITKVSAEILMDFS
ncbi:hypothetical protein ACA910_003133 [Epithemia clementina (nom. ined.)]